MKSSTNKNQEFAVRYIGVTIKGEDRAEQRKKRKAGYIIKAIVLAAINTINTCNSLVFFNIHPFVFSQFLCPLFPSLVLLLVTARVTAYEEKKKPYDNSRN